MAMKEPVKIGSDEKGTLFGMLLPYTDQKMAKSLKTNVPDTSRSYDEEVGPVRRTSGLRSIFNNIDLQSFALFNAELSISIKRFRDEMYRTNFPVFVPAFQHKCTECGTEYDVEVEECEECGSLDLRKPLQKRKRKWKKFFQQVNPAGQSLRDLMEYEEDFQSYYGVSVVIIRKKYKLNKKEVTTPTGDTVIQKTGYETDKIESIQHADPLRVVPVTDKKGQPGGWWVCPDHREEPKEKDDITTKDGECVTGCEICDLPLREVRFVETEKYSGDDDGKTYYFEDEVVQWARHFPLMQGLDGMSPVVPLIRVQALLQFERKYNLSFLDPENQDLPNKMLLIYTTNEEKLRATFTTEEEKTKANPIRTGRLIQEIKDEDDASRMEVIDLTPQELLKDRREKVERAQRLIRSMFGTSNIMEADTTQVQGWDSTGVQLEVNDRSVANAQRDTIDKAIDKIRKSIGMTEWKIEFVDPMRRRQRLDPSQEVQAMQNARREGIPYRYDGEKLRISEHEFEPDQNQEEQLREEEI